MVEDNLQNCLEGMIQPDAAYNVQVPCPSLRLSSSARIVSRHYLYPRSCSGTSSVIARFESRRINTSSKFHPHESITVGGVGFQKKEKETGYTVLIRQIDHESSSLGLQRHSLTRQDPSRKLGTFF
jgi:hypothetical protein